MKVINNEHQPGAAEAGDYREEHPSSRVRKYTFKVEPRANKVEIKAAIEKNFNVTVLDVNITKTHGKRKRYGPRLSKRPDLKKAVVTLKAGDRINLIEGL